MRLSEEGYRLGRVTPLRPLTRAIALGVWGYVLSLAPAWADFTRGAHQFASEQHCVASKKFDADTCAKAAANAAAEFEEKAPRFSSRDACEKVFHFCSVGFKGAAGFAGKASGIYFAPRNDGFRIEARSERDIRVTPAASGFSVSSRTALSRDTGVHPQGPREYRPPAQGVASAYGLASPDGPKGGPLPPRPKVDPNFDCAAVLEPGADPSGGCVLAPANRR